jgi:hypothetical protein
VTMYVLLSLTLTTIHIRIALQGITWVTHNVIVGVSDQMKAKGKQPYRCMAKDQSIHVFTLPESYEEDLEDTLIG